MAEITDINANRADAKKRALAAYAELGIVARACEAAGIARCTWYDWVNSDPEFAQAVREAEEAAIDSLEQEARRRAKAGSDVLLMFCLKAKRPEYRDRAQIDLTATTHHELSDIPDQELSARIAQLLPEVLPKLQAKGLLSSGDK